MDSIYTESDTFLNKMTAALDGFDIDLREGSVIMTIITALSMLLSECTANMDAMYENSFPDAASGEYLDRIVALADISREGALKTVVKVETDGTLVTGEYLSGGDFTYKVTGECDGYYTAECTTAGSAANSYTGEIITKNAHTEMTTLAITGIITAGRDEEDDETLRERFFGRLCAPVCAGNVPYYREALSEISEVGASRIIPVPEGAGTVKVLILDSDMGIPDDTLISYVKELLDPAEKSGMGFGLAPIGHSVTVEAPTAVDVAVSVKLTASGTATASYAIQLANQEAASLAAEINKTWADGDNIIIRDSLFENLFLNELSCASSISDVEITEINGGTGRLVLGENEIVGTVTFTSAE